MKNNKTEEVLQNDIQDQKKKSSQMASQTRKKVLTLVLSIISLIAIFTSITYSWFIFDSVYSTPIDVEVYRPPNMFIGTGDEGSLTKNSTLNLTAINPVVPVVGDGETFYCKNLSYFDITFYSRTIQTGDDYTLFGFDQPDELRVVTDEELPVSVCTLDFKVTANRTGDLILSDQSALAPAFSDSPYSAEIPGLSTGYIAGALRMAIFQKSRLGEYELKCIWIPNATYEFDSTHSTFTTAGQIESSYTFVSPSTGDTTTTKTIQTTDDGYVVDDGILYIWDISKCSVPFAQYLDEVDGDLRVVIWLDGNDRECVNALAGGRVNLEIGVYLDNEEVNY